MVTMIQEFRPIFAHMNRLLLLLALHPCVLAAQVTHQVEVGGSTIAPPAPFYAPQHLVIDEGDIVHWINVSGTHNVNGGTNIYPANPEGFYSGLPSASLDFQFTFTIPGVYEYHCDQQGHAATQHGTITVIETSSVRENEWIGTNIFPNPASRMLVIEPGEAHIVLAEIIDREGRIVATHALNYAMRKEINLEQLADGLYHIRLASSSGAVTTRTFQKIR
jgi:plastocyanin